MRSIVVFFSLWVFLVASHSIPVNFDAPVGWTLFWNDEFNGTSLDTSKWSTLTQPSPRNNELEYYTSEDVYVSGGNLVLRSQKRSYDGLSYTSGLVNSTGKFSTTFGRFEIRAKIPYGDGLWPAHWLLPENNICWPTGGEFDIMENLGQDTKTVYGTYHWGTKCNNNVGSQGTYKSSTSLSSDFHIYAIEWEKNTIRWYVDDYLYHYVNASSTLEIPSISQYWILNTAIGGAWPVPPNNSTVWPQYHLIDYVRVYK